MADQPKPSLQSLEASLLYCATCRQAMPVRKQLFMILSEGNKFECLCNTCSTKCGDKIELNDDPESRLLM